MALSYNGTTQAVMMASPDALEDFGLGFTLTEGFAAPDEIAEISVVRQGPGFDIRIWVDAAAGERLAARRRTMLGPVGCGLCGIESIEASLRPVRPVTTALSLSEAEVAEAVALLPGQQALHDLTRAVHAAGFYRPGEGIVAVREDVGRHNALDKLAGALARAGLAGAEGAVLLTCRTSVDMVQKCAAIGAGIVIASSAPTAHAVRIAEAAAITLIGLARTEAFEIFTHPHRITPGGQRHVA